MKTYKINEAIRILRETCQEQTDCHKCPLSDRDDDCKLGLSTPWDWDTIEEEDLVI